VVGISGFSLAQSAMPEYCNGGSERVKFRNEIAEELKI
jgi:hypothetical protein